MGGANAADGQGFHGAFTVQQGLAVFDAENVVGTLEQGSILRGQALSYRALPGGGKAVPHLQLLAEQGRKLLALQRCSRAQQGRSITALAAKGQVGEDVGGKQSLHRASGEPFRGADGPGKGQFQHQVRAALDSGFGPGLTAQEGKVSPLDEISAHAAKNGGVLPQNAAGLTQKVDMAHMKGIVFYYDTGCVHKNLPQVVTKK